MASPVLRVTEIALEHIKPDPNQVRRLFDEESIAGLALSIESDGLQSPIQVKAMAEGLFEIVTGERRFKAFLRLGRKTITAFVVEDALTPARQTLQQLVENVQREGLNEVELGLAYQRLMQESGWNGQQVAEKVGVAPATVSRHVRLLDCEPEVQDAIASGKLHASKAYKLLTINDPLQRSALFKRAIAGDLKRDDIPNARQSHSTAAPFASTTLVLSATRSLTVRAQSQTIAVIRGILKETDAYLRKAEAEGISLATVVRIRKEQARRSTNTVIRPKGSAR